MLCLQLVLRKQLRWLITVRKMPEELEALTKDLWALRLQKVQSRISYESETDTEAPSAQFFSSQSESEVTSASRSTRRSRKEKGRVREGSPRLVETLALCYISLLLLRIPVTVGDIHKWANEGQLLYHRVAREVPLGMRERLPPRYQAQLEPQDLLKPTTVQTEVVQLMNLNFDFGMSPPVLNLPLVRYRWVRELMLPIEVYAACQRLAQLLAIDFEFDLSTKTSTSANITLRYPEGRLMGVMVAATKLLFPFDDIERTARSRTDLSGVSMDWQEWAKQMSDLNKAEAGDQALSFDECFRFDEARSHTVSDDKLDAYLDWYQDNIATEEIRERGRAGRDADLRRAMFAMFPAADRTAAEPLSRTTTDGQSSLDSNLRKVQSKLRPRLILDSGFSDEEVCPVGNSYRRVRDANELSRVARAFYERAAEVAGLGLDDMVQITFAIERKMQMYEERLRKQSAGR